MKTDETILRFTKETGAGHTGNADFAHLPVCRLFVARNSQ